MSYSSAYDAHLEMGLRVSLIDAGLHVYLVDGNIPTFDDRLSGKEKT